MTVLRYSLLRILLLFGCLLVLWLVGVREPLWLLLATAVSSVALSYFVLKGPREALARQLAERVDRRTAQKSQDRDAEAEDREVEAEDREVVDSVERAVDTPERPEVPDGPVGPDRRDDSR